MDSPSFKVPEEPQAGDHARIELSFPPFGRPIRFAPLPTGRIGRLGQLIDFDRCRPSLLQMATHARAI